MAGTPPVYNGQTTNFSGEGSPNPQKLVIPGKDKMDPVVRTAMLAIEQWCNNLVAPPSSSGVYASLTGPGEITTPGDLEQLGPFTVTTSTNDATLGVGFGVLATGVNINLTTVSSGSIILLSAHNGAFTSANSMQIGGNATTLIQGSAASGFVTIAGNSDKLAFYGDNNATGGISIQTVAGSRGGNAALTSLLAALHNLSLIINSSSP